MLTHRRICRETLALLERALRGLPPPPPALGERPRWMVPSDGLPVIYRIRGSRRSAALTCKITRAYPSGWNNGSLFTVAYLRDLPDIAPATIAAAIMRRVERRPDAESAAAEAQ